MRWVEQVFNTHALHRTTDAGTEEPLTVAFTAALGHEHEDRVGIETLPGTHATIDEFDRACDGEIEERRKVDGLHYFMVLPLREAYAFAEALCKFLQDLPPEHGKGSELRLEASG